MSFGRSPGLGARVLITDGGNGQNRSAVAAVRALAAAGHRPFVTVSAPRSLAAASRWCAGAVPVPPVEQREAYRDAVRDAGRDHALVLPASDAALVALEHPGRELVDKAELRRRAAEVGIPVPPEQEADSWEQLIGVADELTYPAVLKPVMRDSTAQPPVRRVADAAELRSSTPYLGRIVVQPYLPEPMSAVSGVAWQGRLVAVAHQRYLRLWPVEAGVASAAVTVDGDPVLEERLARLLDGHDGIFQAQFVGPYLVDLNPRVYGSLPLAVAAGTNLPDILVRLHRGGAPGSTARARAGVRYRWLEGDVRAVLSDVRRRERTVAGALADLAPRRGTAHSTESLTDPGPSLMRARAVLSSRSTRSRAPEARRSS